MTSRLVTSIMGGLLLVGLAAGPASAVSSDDSDAVVSPAACVVTATTPWSGPTSRVYFEGVYSGCGSSTMNLQLKWANAGPDLIMSSKNIATSGANYYRHCNWGSPQNRVLYTRASIVGGPDDLSSTSTFTSSTTSCRL